MDFPLPFSIFVGIISIMAFCIICIACSLVLRNLCYLGNNNLMWRSNDARRAANTQAEQQVLTVHPPPSVAGNEGQNRVMQPFLPQNQLVQPIPSQEQTKQEFPAQGHQIQYHPQQQQFPAQGQQMQYYPQQQQSVLPVAAKGYQMQHYPQQQEFQQPATTPQFQQLPTAPEIYNQDLPPSYGECLSYK